VNDRLFFIISGEHPTLPAAELRAILEAESCQFHIVDSTPKLLLVDAPRSCIEPVSTRSSMCTISGYHILESSNDHTSIQKAIKQNDLSNILRPGDTFSVRVVKTGTTQHRKNSATLEAYVGKIVKETVKDISVDLTKPDKPLVGIMSDEKFVLGLEKYRREPGGFARRRPRKRPVFHPSTMPPKLALCMLNLARPGRGDIVLDPFCGVGGILIESSLLGYRTIGCDILLQKVQDSLLNMNFFGLEPFGMVLADARSPPFQKVNAIVTDPPYGTLASTHGSTAKEVFSEFLKAANEIVSHGGCICLGAPEKLEVESLGREADLELVERHKVYIHRSLTREIAVFKRR
jgi:tRNA (guanine10-N2)-dimethyltransferase